MVLASREEFRHTALLLFMLFGSVSVKDVLDASFAGSSNGLFDALVHVNGHRLFFDYDGGFYHGIDRLAHDMEKSLRVIHANADACVFRLRTNDAPPFTITHARLKSEHTSSGTLLKNNVIVMMNALAALSLGVALFNIDVSRIQMCVSAAEAAWRQLNAERQARYDELSAYLGGAALADKLLKSPGLQNLFCHRKLIPQLIILISTLSLSKVQLTKVMCGGFASRLMDPDFIAA